MPDTNDVCPGGDDSIDNNGDGIADCSQLLPYSEYHEDWKCANGKISVCHNGTTICISINALPAHFYHGDNIGPCTSCGGQNLIAPNGNGSFGVAGHLELEIFPNPASAIVTINLHGLTEGQASLWVFDNLGREVFQQKLGDGTSSIQFDLSPGKFPNGEYFVKVATQDGVLTNRFIVLR